MNARQKRFCFHKEVGALATLALPVDESTLDKAGTKQVVSAVKDFDATSLTLFRGLTCKEATAKQASLPMT